MIDALEDHSPKTLEDAVSLICNYLTDEEVHYIEEHGAVSCHHGFGTHMRNAWLWDDPSEDKIRPLAQHFRDRFGLGHADDMSGLILEGVDAHVRGTVFNPDQHAQDFKKFWRDQGVDALTQEPLPVAPEAPRRTWMDSIRERISRFFPAKA